jgi:hypothetical protein
MPWRGSDGSIAGGSYESWVDKQIREAQERGEFDDLPGAGEPLKLTGADPDWWVKSLIKRENLDMSAAMPEGLALRKRAQELPERVLREHSEQAVRDLVEDFNVRVREFWKGSHDGPPVVVRTMDADDVVETWSAKRAARQTATVPEHDVAPSDPPAKRRRRWWHFFRRQ